MRKYSFRGLGGFQMVIFNSILLIVIAILWMLVGVIILSDKKGEDA